MASRTSSRASTGSRPRPSSRTAGYTDASQLTPRRPTTASAARLGGLSAKEVNKISSTIASVRKPATKRGLRDPIAEEDDDGDLSVLQGRNRLAAADGSFVNGTSFTSAPLNSRIPAFSPRKNGTNRLPSISSQSTEDDDGDLEAASVEDEDATALPRRSKGKRRKPVKEDLGALDREIQEALVAEDLLFVLMGVEGTYIEFDPEYEPEDAWEQLQGARFIVDDSLDPSLQEVVARILPVATHYTAIHAFTEVVNHMDYGLVNHALCAAIRGILHEFLTLLAQLEHQFNTSPTFTLQRFWYHIHPTLHTLALLHSLVAELSYLHTPTAPASSDDEDSDPDMDEGLKAVIASATGKASAAGSAPGLVKGGEVIAVLESRLHRTAGDPAAVSLFTPLLLAATQPYARMLLRWVDHGTLDDPYDEFMIKEAKNITRGTLDMDFTDEYWERKYALRCPTGIKVENAGTLETEERKMLRSQGYWGGAVVPGCLEGWKNKVLLAGKYVNVMRECGLAVTREQIEEDSDGDDTMISMDEASFYRRITDAYTLANRSLLKLLLENQDFPGRLRSLRHHFFLAQGDAFTTFLDTAAHELAKRAKAVNVQRLQSQFDLAIRNPSSSSSGDPYKEDVKLALDTTTMAEWLLRVLRVSGNLEQTPGDAQAEGLDALDLNAVDRDTPTDKDGAKREQPFTGMDALKLDYTVRFPISLVISRKTLLRYQLLFRHLLQLKHLEQALGQIWADQMHTASWSARTRAAPFEGWKRRAFGLRAAMFMWVQCMYAFASNEVLERQWGVLIDKIGKVDTVDGLLRDHVDFLDTCLKECMLTNPRLLKLNQRLAATCSKFASYMPMFTAQAAQFRAAIDAVDGDWDRVSAKVQQSFAQTDSALQKFEHNFYHHTKIHFDMCKYVASSENLALLALVVRLNNVPSATA